MKISILSTFYPYRGGIAQFSAASYRALEKKHNVLAYTFKRQYPHILFPGKTQFVTNNDKADVIPSKRVLDSINPLNWISVATKIKKENPDLLFINFWMPYFAPSMGYIAGKLSKETKIISLLHNVSPHEQGVMDKVLLKYFLKKSHGFIVMSQQTKSDLLALNPNAKLIYKPHPLYNHFGKALNKADACQKLGLNPNKKTILYFGIIRKYKGLDILLDAFAKLDNTYQLLIAGENYGSYDAYKAQINVNPNKDRIFEHVRYVSDDEVPLFFSAADACVLPYRSATQSGITAIAYHFNLPIIATNVGGLAEMVIDNETGIIIPEAKVELVANGIKRFFEKQDVNFVANIEKKKAELSWPGFAKAIEDLYQQL